MHFVFGALLIVMGAAMIWAGMPKKGKPTLLAKAPFFTELYIVAAVTGMAVGVTILFLGLPD